MATRVYFSDSEAAPVTPPAPSGTDWEHINSVVQGLLLAPDASALNTAAYTPDTADDLTNRDAHHRQYVSQPLKAQTISGNVKAQFQCFETFNNDNLFLTLKVLVCNNDGSSILATLLAITRDTTNELTTALTNRNFPSTALSSYACADGDRIVIEIGLGGNITSGAGGIIGHNGSIRWGCSASSGDLPENDAETGTTFRPWAEFSNTIKFLAEAVAESVGSAAMAIVGAALWLGVFASSGVSTASGTSGSIIGAVGSSDGIANDSVVGAQIVASAAQSDGSAIVSGLMSAFISAEFASAGTASANAESAAIAGATGSSDGVATASAIATAIGVATASSDGVASDAVQGSLIAASLANSDGSASADAISATVLPSIGSSIGSSTAQADGEDAGGGGITEAEGHSSGSAIASGIGAAISVALGSSDNVGDASGIGSTIFAATGNSDAGASVSGEGASMGTATGSSDGLGEASAIGANISAGVGNAAGSADCVGESESTAEKVNLSASFGDNKPTIAGEFSDKVNATMRF